MWSPSVVIVNFTELIAYVLSAFLKATNMFILDSSLKRTIVSMLK